jgi:hypothetical protein
VRPLLLIAATSAIASAGDDVPSVPATIAVTASATSTLSDKHKTYDAWYALGSDPTKFWCEGKPDEGIGEALVLTFATPIKIDSLTLRAGVWRSPELFRANNRITTLEVVSDNGVKKVTLHEEREDVDVAVGGGPINKLELRIAAVTKGKLNDTCISGVELHTSPESSVVLVGAAAPDLGPAFAKVWRAFGDCDERTLRAQLQFPFRYGDTTRAKRYADAKAVRKACKDLAFTSFTPQQPSLRVKAEAPGKVQISADTLEWHFALDRGAWKLVSLVDQTP